jgi:hypothetical protein
VKSLRQAAKGLGVGGAALALVAGGALLAGGAAVAANTVGSGDIKNNSIRQHDIADGAVGSGEIINNTIRRHDIADGSVGPGEILDGSVRAGDLDPALADGLKGEKGDTGDAGPAGPEGPAGPAGPQGDPGLAEVESDGPYPGATQLGDFPGNGSNSTDQWTNAGRQVSWVKCADGKVAIGGGFNLAADAGDEKAKQVQVVVSEPSGDVIEGDAAMSLKPTGWRIEGFYTGEGSVVVRPWVVCATVAE